MKNQKQIFTIDGLKFTTLDGFYDAIERALIPGASWGRNLDAFNDILSGGFGTPDEGFILRWQNSDRSRETLGYPETVRQLMRRLQKCHPSNQKQVQTEILRAEKGVGPTVFDWLIEIIEDHGEGGEQAYDGVELELN